MVKTGHSKRKLFTNAKEQKENTTPQDHVNQVSYASGGTSAGHQPIQHHSDLHEGSNIPLKYSRAKPSSAAAAASQRPLPNIAGPPAVASSGPAKHSSSSSAASIQPSHDGRGGLACLAVTSSSPRPHTMPMSERQQIALLLQMSSPSPPSKGMSKNHNPQSGVSSLCNSPYSPECGGQDYGPLYGGTVQLAQQHYSGGMVTGSGGRGGGVAKRNERGETPLHVAAIRGDADRVHHLIARGSDVNAVDYAGWTALHEACNRGFVSVARELISAGACVNAKGLDNETPLHDACVNNHFQIVELLLESGASTSVLNRRGQTPGEVCRSPGILSLLRQAKQNSADSTHSASSSGSASKMSRRTPPNNKLDCAKMDLKQTDSVKAEKDIKTEDVGDSGSASSGGAAASSGGPTAASTTASGSSTAAGGGGAGASGSPGSPRVTLRLPPSAARTPEKTARSASDNKGSEAGSDDPYEFKCSKDEPGHGAAGSSAAVTDNPSKGGDGAAGEERGEKRPVTEDEDEGEQAKKKKRKEDPGKEAAAAGGTALPGKAANRGGRATGDKSSKPTARSAPLHGAASAGFGAGVSKSSTGSGASSGFQGSASTTPTSSSTNSSVTNSGMASGSSSSGGTSSSSSSGGGASGSSSEANRKSPLISASNSPKSSIKQEKCEDGSDDEGSRPDTAPNSGGGGPKVPPLKIVLSSCGGGSSNTSGASSQEQEQSGPQTGKSASARHLPYVVPANQVEQSVKEETAPPPDSKDASTHGVRVKDEPMSPGGSTGGEKSAPRITRSQRGTGSNSADESSTAVKLEVKQEDSSGVSTTSSGGGGSSGSSNSNSATSNGGNNNSSSSTTSVTAPATTTTTTSSSSSGGSGSSNESVHPRKRKLNIKEEEPEPSQPSLPEQPLSNCYQMFMKIRKQIDDRRKLLFPVQPKPPQGFKDYLMNRGTYVLAGNPSSQQSVPCMDPPTALSQPLKDLFTEQERDRYKLRLQHQIEREKLVLSVEQEILREHGRAARALANQALPFSACTVLRDQEVYNILTPEQEEKHRNARSRYNGRLFLSWLQDVDDKWEKIKESMVLRQQNEAESLNAVHRMDWEWKMKELGLCDNKSRPVIEDLHVPTVAVSDFDLLPA